MIYLNRVPQISFIYTFLSISANSEISKTVTAIKTNFSCLDKTAGFYADIDARCKIYHTCDEYGNKFTYRCPEETAFRQDALICDHAHLVNCEETIPFHIENMKKKHNNSCINGSMNDNNCQYFFQSSRDAQTRATHSVMQHGFTLNLHRFLKNFNETNLSKDNTMKLLPPQIEKFRNQQFQLRTNENFSKGSQIFNNNNKVNEMKDSIQEDYFNKKTNTTLHHFLRIPTQTFSGNMRHQQNNKSNNQTTKTPSDVPNILSFDNNRNNPYTETLNSIQRRTKISSFEINAAISNTTTEIPIYALTLSLKPLIPRELEYDPYYPQSTSTESYYTPSHNNKKLPYAKSFNQNTWSNTHIELPPVLPDLRLLEDIVDRRKLFYIPRI